MMIQSLAQKAYLHGLSSPLLYTSNCKEKPVQNLRPSIYETFQAEHLDIKLDEQMPNDSAWHKYGKPVRFLARIIYAKVVSLIIAPIGVVYHGIYAIGYTVKWISNHSKEEKEKALQHAFSLMEDLGIAVLGYMGTAVLVVMPYKEVIQDVINLTDLRALGLPLALIGINMDSFTYGVSPQNTCTLFFNDKMRVLYFKAVTLKNEFGLVNSQGGILSCNEKDDESVNGQGLLWEMWITECLNLLDLIRELKEKNPTLAENIATYPCDGNKIANALRGAKEFNHFTDLISRFEKVQKSIESWKSFLLKCLNERHNAYIKQVFTIGKPTVVKITLNEFPFDLEYCNIYLERSSQKYANLPSLSKWDEVIYKYQQEIQTFKNLTIEELDPVSKREHYHREYMRFKTLVLKADQDPFKFLALDGQSATKEEVEKAYKKLTLVLHPDKHLDEEIKKQMKILFQCLSEVLKQILERKG